MCSIATFSWPKSVYFQSISRSLNISDTSKYHCYFMSPTLQSLSISYVFVFLAHVEHWRDTTYTSCLFYYVFWAPLNNMCMCAQLLSHVWLFVTPWTVNHKAPLSIEFSRQEYWSELPCPPPGYFPNPGVKPRPPALQLDSFPSELPGKPLKQYAFS